MLESVIFYLSQLCLVVGAFFMISGAIGVVRFPDFYTRMHAAGVLESLGAPLIILGVILLHGWSLFTVKLIFLIILLWVTGPTASHIVAKSAFLSGLKPVKRKK